MKIRIIDLLEMIANGQIPPKKIYYLEETFIYDEQSKDYYDSETYGLFDSYEIPPMLNDEVEIIEDNKKIEKLENYISCGWAGTCKDLPREELFEDLKKIGNKINEIIDKINKE